MKIWVLLQKMNRYILSFLLTSFLYVIVGTIIVYTPINKSNSIEESIKDSIIKISMISIKPKVEPIPKVEPEAEPIIDLQTEPHRLRSQCPKVQHKEETWGGQADGDVKSLRLQTRVPRELLTTYASMHWPRLCN